MLGALLYPLGVLLLLSIQWGVIAYLRGSCLHREYPRLRYFLPDLNSAVSVTRLLLLRRWLSMPSLKICIPTGSPIGRKNDLGRVVM